MTLAVLISSYDGIEDNNSAHHSGEPKKACLQLFGNTLSPSKIMLMDASKSILYRSDTGRIPEKGMQYLGAEPHSEKPQTPKQQFTTTIVFKLPDNPAHFICFRLIHAKLRKFIKLKFFATPSVNESTLFGMSWSLQSEFRCKWASNVPHVPIPWVSASDVTWTPRSQMVDSETETTRSMMTI